MSALVSVIPIVLLFVLMLGFKMAGHKSAFITLVVTIILALFVAPAMGMLPEKFTGSSIYGVVWWSFVEGVFKAVFPILIIILMAIYSYNILVESKEIEVIKDQFTSFTDDKGILVLMLVWGFGGLLEGMAGFGTAVAIPAAILIGLGFKPMFSALVALIGNTVATGFGAVGVPVTTLCNEVAPGGSASAEAICETSAFAVLQLSPLFIILPFIILMLTDKKAIVKNIALAVWTGVISVVVQFLCAKYLGAETPAIIGSVAAIIAIIIYAKLFAKKKGEQREHTGKSYTMGETFRAWSVYLFILVFILLSGALCPPVNQFLKSHLVTQVPLPVIGSTFKFGWISNAGLMLLPGRYHRRNDSGTELQETNGCACPYGRKPSEHRHHHHLAHRTGLRDELFRNDWRHCRWPRSTHRFVLSHLCSADWCHRHICHGFRHFIEYPLRQVAGQRCRTIRHDRTGHVLRC